MKSIRIVPFALVASLCFGAVPRAASPAVGESATTRLAASDAAAVTPSGPGLDERAALRAAEQRDADLAELKAGFAMGDSDMGLVLGTVAVVVLIVLLV